MQPRYLTELDAVGAFVDRSWGSRYLTMFSRETPDGRLYLTRLHAPDGPIVYTLVKPDGLVEDLTRQ